MIENLKNLIDFGIKNGANSIEIIMDASSSISSGSRLEKPETCEISDTHEAGIRIIKDEKQIFLSTTDTSQDNLQKQIENGLNAISYLPKDPFAKIIDVGFCESFIDSSQYHDTESLSAPQLLEMSQRLENIALNTPGITNSEGASAGFSSYTRTIVSSNGFQGICRKSSFSCGISVIAGQNEHMKTDYDYDTALFKSDLRPIEDIAAKAVKRALDKLNAVTIKTGVMPVVFDRRAGKGVLRSFFSAINGRNISEKTSFLKDDMNSLIFPKNITIIDSPLLARGISSRPFDDEGILGKNLEIIKDGVLQSWILDYTCGLKLGLSSTGHASRGISGPSSPKTTNICFEGDFGSKENILADIPFGFYITELMGEGGNPVTGDFSSGASGFLIENGRLTTPIHEATIAGKLKDMFSSIILANDFEKKGGLDSPTFMIPNLTVGGD